MEQVYDKNSIETLPFKEAVRKRIAMYLGSADMEGVYNSIQEIISNSIDEYIMGYGDIITIKLFEDGSISVADKGRGVPFGDKNGENVLESIFSKAHTGGKFNDKAYQRVVGLNGIGGKATCLSSEFFSIQSGRDNQVAYAMFEKGNLVKYEESPQIKPYWTGTAIRFKPDSTVFNLEEINIDYNHLCKMCRNLSYLTPGLTFTIINLATEKTQTYKSENGLVDLIKDKVKSPIHPIPLSYTLDENGTKIEIALQWTKDKEKSYCFTNGLLNSEGGTPITGIKTSITRNLNKSFKGQLTGDLARTGLVYAVSCSVLQPSFANQTKTKINNPELRSIADKAFSEAWNHFCSNYPDAVAKIEEYLLREKRAEEMAEKARQAVYNNQKTIQAEIKKKNILAGKLVDCEKHDASSQLVIVEGKSAGGAVGQARDSVTTAFLPLRGKPISVLKNSEEDIFNNAEIKELQIALGLSAHDMYNPKKLRYGRVALMADADMDGNSIMCLLLTFFYKYYPQMIEDGLIYWAKTPLFKIETKNKVYFAYDEEELAKLPKGDISRLKGIGELNAEDLSATIFSPEGHYIQFTMEDAEAANYYFYMLMGQDVEDRRDFIFENIDFEKVEE